MTIISKSCPIMVIDSPAPIEICEEAFNNADYLHQWDQSEGRPRDIAIMARKPGTHMDSMAIPSLIHHANDMDKDWYNGFHKHPTSSGKKQSDTTKIEIAPKHRSPGFCLPPTAIETKPVINDRDQQTWQWVKMDWTIPV